MSVVERARLAGTSVPRIEDARILAGRGSYLDDIRIPGLLHAAFVRSVYAHARIVGIDAEAARELPGALAVYTGSDIAAVTAPLQMTAEIAGYLRPVYHALAIDKARHMGDPVAIVVARTRAEAEDAAEAVLVDYEPLPAVPDASAGAGPAASLVFEDVGSNLLYECDHVHGDVDAAFEGATHVVRATFTQQRVTNVPMEGRGGIADFDPLSGELTYHSSTQVPHVVRSLLASALDLPVSLLRVIAPDVGGGFGQKIPLSREDIALCAAARLLGRPVKWAEDRAENLTAGGQAREETLEGELALAADGAILGLRVRMTLDHGAYPAAPIPAPVYLDAIRVALPGGYRIPAVAFEGRIVATNKASYVPYRGPWAAETLVREGLLDTAARALAIDPIELRRRNLVPRRDQPEKTVLGVTLERMAALDTLERAAELLDAGVERAAGGGVLRGVGVAVLVEPAPGPPDYNEAAGFGPGFEPARAKLELDGRITLYTSQCPNGQGHETTLAQVCADTIGVAFEDVTVLHGDTDSTPFNLTGTGGSRAATMASGAAAAAVRRLRDKVLDTAAARLDVPTGLLVLESGTVRMAGEAGRELTLAEVAACAQEVSRTTDEEPGLQAVARFEQPEGGWTTATHVCFVEIDEATGITRIPRYLVVEDCGRMINPAIVEGQIRGGVVQGIGQAMLEHVAYDDDGQLLTATFMDYLLPTALDAPPIEIEHLAFEDLADDDFRGVGEGGAMAAPAAVVNAVSNALGRTAGTLPLTPERILALRERHA